MLPESDSAMSINAVAYGPTHWLSKRLLYWPADEKSVVQHWLPSYMRHLEAVQGDRNLAREPNLNMEDAAQFSHQFHTDAETS